MSRPRKDEKKRNKMKMILMITSDQNPRELEEESRIDHIMPDLEPIALIGEQRCCDFVE